MMANTIYDGMPDPHGFGTTFSVEQDDDGFAEVLDEQEYNSMMMQHDNLDDPDDEHGAGDYDSEFLRQ